MLIPVLLLLAAATAPSSAGKTNDPFYVIAHMANSEYSLDWAVQQGANGIEHDIRFDDNGNPTHFRHGYPCDCTCTFAGSTHICNGARYGSGPLNIPACLASNDAANHLRRIANLPQVALVIMDGKVDPKWGTRLRTAGTKLVELLQNHLFGNGYRGKVIISAGKINCYDYVYSAAIAASRTSNRDQYFFSFDQEGNNYKDVVSLLSRFTANRVFGTGITSCAPGNYQSGIQQAVSGVNNGQIGMSYIWTLDKESSMETYINLGVQGILTNRPAVLRNLAVSKGLRLASTWDAIPLARTNVQGSNKCDCDYHRGGCTISFPPPPGQACRCRYKLAWTCGASLVRCNWGNEKCQFPDASREACQLGGGDCGGY